MSAVKYKLYCLTEKNIYCLTEFLNINRPTLTLKHGDNKTIAVSVSVYAKAPASVLPLSHWLHVYVNYPHIELV